MVIGIGWGFINPANHTPMIPAATTYVTPQGVDAQLRRHHGDSRRRRRRVLRLHRLRRGLDRGAGSEEPEARHADRHPRLAGRLHDPLRAVLLRAERRGDGRGLPVDRPRSVGRLRDLEVHARLRVAVARGDGGDPGRVLVGHPGHAARPVARVLLDEPATAWCRRSSRTCIRATGRRTSRTCCSSCSRRCSRRSFPATSSAR